MWSSHFRAEQKILCCHFTLGFKCCLAVHRREILGQFDPVPTKVLCERKQRIFACPRWPPDRSQHTTTEAKFFALIAYHFTLCFLPNEESAVVCKEQNSPKHATFLHGHDQFSSSALLIKTATLPTLFFTMRCQILSWFKVGKFKTKMAKNSLKMPFHYLIFFVKFFLDFFPDFFRNFLARKFKLFSKSFFMKIIFTLILGVI